MLNAQMLTKHGNVKHPLNFHSKWEHSNLMGGHLKYFISDFFIYCNLLNVCDPVFVAKILSDNLLQEVAQMFD